MILSVSRRTDIPAFYSDWFYNRVREGFALVRNPLNTKQISKVLINTEVCDCIVFWTKNPAPMLARLDEIKNYPYYFHFTLNSYNQSLECRVPKKKQIVETFKQLSSKIGSHRVIWRYDPIFLTPEIDIDYHIKYFEWIAEHLAGYTDLCKICPITMHKKTKRNMKHTFMRELDEETTWLLAKSLAEIAKTYNIEVQSCTMQCDLGNIGIRHGKCTDEVLIGKIAGYNIAAPHNTIRPQKCNCIESIDIGEYHTCLHNCLYCYANDSDNKVQQKYKQHIKASPVLIGAATGCLSGEGALRPSLAGEEPINIKERKCVSLRVDGLL